MQRIHIDDFTNARDVRTYTQIDFHQRDLRVMPIVRCNQPSIGSKKRQTQSAIAPDLMPAEELYKSRHGREPQTTMGCDPGGEYVFGYGKERQFTIK